MRPPADATTESGRRRDRERDEREMTDAFGSALITGRRTRCPNHRTHSTWSQHQGRGVLLVVSQLMMTSFVS